LFLHSSRETCHLRLEKFVYCTGGLILPETTRAGSRAEMRPAIYLIMGSDEKRNRYTDRLVMGRFYPRSIAFLSDRNILFASHTAATNTCTGFVRNAGLFPSIKCPSHASAKAVGISSSAMTQCHQTTMIEENPTGIAIMCSARFTGWLCAPS